LTRRKEHPEGRNLETVVAASLVAPMCRPILLHTHPSLVLLLQVVVWVRLSKPQIASATAGLLAELAGAVELVLDLVLPALVPEGIVRLRGKHPVAALTFPLTAFPGRFGVFRLHGAPPSARSIAETSVDGRQEAFWAAAQ